MLTIKFEITSTYIVSCITLPNDDIIYAAVLTVEFSTAEYVVNEGENGSFTIELSLQADRNVSVMLNTTDGSARG